VSEQRAHGWGLATVVTDGASAGTVLDTWYPSPALGAPQPDSGTPKLLEQLAGEHPDRRVRTEVRLVEIDLGSAPRDVSDG
jgi:2,3,4,5-tetrahydropyridine-2-carboxylate N-succinyltransferase